MAKLSLNKKFVTLDEVKVYYNRKENTIQIISGDEDLVGKPFQVTLNQGTASENSLRELLHEKGVIDDSQGSAPMIPKFVPYPLNGFHEPYGKEWNKIFLGVGEKKTPIGLDVEKTPHVLVSGGTGSGKSVLQRNFFLHCVNNSDDWKFLGIDLKRVELQQYKKFQNTVLGIANNLEDSVEILRYAEEVMNKRYEEMKKKNTPNFRALVDEQGKPPYAVMLMIDELFLLVNKELEKCEETKKNNQLHVEASQILDKIVRSGRAAGIYLVLATQRPDMFFKNEAISELYTRIHAGSIADVDSETFFGGDAFGEHAVKPQSVKIGRCFMKSDGLIAYGTTNGSDNASGGVVEFQTYYASAELIEETARLNKIIFGN